jgi:hypothetical protein
MYPDAPVTHTTFPAAELIAVRWRGWRLSEGGAGAGVVLQL